MDLTTARSFLADKHNGILITTKRDGRPQSSNVSYALDGDHVVVSVTESRAKTRNLRRDPRASLHVNADDFWGYVVLEADVELMPVAADPDDPTADALVEYYRTLRGEHPDWDDYRRAMVTDGRLLLILHPTRAYGFVS
jgi:PPOX class probable F420-dependent enzyme